MDKIQILCTRPVDDLLIAEANDSNISIDVLSFIDTEPIESEEVQQEIEHALVLTASVVFTSMNAVEAVADILYDDLPRWNIYCIGNTTRELVERNFGKDSIAGTAASATELAELIIAEGETEEVIFFCGDQRRDELPLLLRGNGIEVNEIVVYHTIEVPNRISKEYKGILFFSPSSVKSFFSVNKIHGSTVLFAIGNTTAATIKNYSTNKIIIADKSTKENLFEKMAEYFT